MKAKLTPRPYQVKLVVEGSLSVELLAASAEEAIDSVLEQSGKYVGLLENVTYRVVDARVKP